MHIFGLVLFGLIASFWLTHGIRVAYGAVRLPWIKDFAPASDADCPRISILFAARDEEEKLPAALATLMEIDDLQVRVIDFHQRGKCGWQFFFFVPGGEGNWEGGQIRVGGRREILSPRGGNGGIGT